MTMANHLFEFSLDGKHSDIIMNMYMLIHRTVSLLVFQLALLLGNKQFCCQILRFACLYQPARREENESTLAGIFILELLSKVSQFITARYVFINI